jgi:hypothetical protein
MKGKEADIKRRSLFLSENLDAHLLQVSREAKLHYTEPKHECNTLASSG